MVDAIVGVLVENLNSLIGSEFNLISGIKEDMRKLLRTLSTIRDVIEDAELKQVTEKPIANWLTKLKDAAYDADDVLDEWLCEAEEYEIAYGGLTNQVSHYVSSRLNIKNIIFRRKIAKRMKKIISTFDEIAAQKSKFILNTGVVLQTGSRFDKSRETTSRITELHIYGRDEDKKNIIDILFNGVGNREDVSVCSIVGIGGLGKTTLAQSIYNDEMVIRCFEVRIWVCVSEPFDVERVLKAIIEAFEKKPCDLKTLEPVQSKVGDILREKRYLLVLDDVWNENQDEWNKLKGFFNGGAKGSSIILTTRSETVASFTCAPSTYRLGVLSDDDCWSLLKDRAFGDTGEDYLNLVTIGMEIVNKCKGLPLAVKSLGSLLWSKTDENYWKLVRDSEIWNLEGGESTILSALRLNYNHLSSCSKQCFAYCSVFPKDHKMEKNKLIDLWIANGFLQSDTRMEVEETGDVIFNELLRMSFFEDTTEDDYGSIETCKMHDLMHDLACFVAGSECLTKKVCETKHVPKKVRHLSVIPDSPHSSTSFDPLLTSQPSLRSLFFSGTIQCHSFKFPLTLRVLDLSYMTIDSLPPSICQLKQLRYLNLSCNLINSLPTSICRLKNLQILDLSDSDKITTLPQTIGMLEHLRYLNLSGTRITSLPKSIHRLRKLQRLDLSGNHQIRTLPTSIGNLDSLRYFNLSECKGITSLPESIGCLRNLKSLILSWCSKLEALPENMRYMSSLRHLDIDGCVQLTKMPIGIGQLTGLQTLYVFVVGKPCSDRNCGSIKELQRLNQLRGRLVIKGLENVRNSEDAKEANLSSKQYLTELKLHWSSDDANDDSSQEVLESLQLPPNVQELEIKGYPSETCFPQLFPRNLEALESLEISDCNKLRSLPEEIEHLTALTSLRISECRELVLLPEGLQKLTSLRVLEIWGCDNIKCLPVMAIQGLNTSSLLDLDISSCANLTSLSAGLQNLISLEKLHISECPELEFSEGDFEHLISLRTLVIRKLPKLKSLPEGIQQLTMLEEIDIWDCGNLRTLPEGLQHVTNLHFMYVRDCHPDLHKRWEKEKGHSLKYSSGILMSRNNLYSGRT